MSKRELKSLEAQVKKKIREYNKMAKKDKANSRLGLAQAYIRDPDYYQEPDYVNFIEHVDMESLEWFIDNSDRY